MADLLLHPTLPLVIAAALSWVLPARIGRSLMIVAPLVAIAQLAAIEPGLEATGRYLGFDVLWLRADGLAMPFAWVFALVALIAGIYGLATQDARERTSALIYAAAAMGVVFAGDLLTFFVAWEIKAVASTFVILARRSPRSGRAGMRYLFVHVLGGKLLLAGVLWHYADTGSLLFTGFDPTPATVLILLACAISAAIPPLHAWLPDAYPQATVAGTVFLSAYTTKAAVYALARGFAGWEILIVLGVIMTLYGVVYAVLENDVRRLLGYHIVSQVGFMVAAVGVGTGLAINGATAHAFAHILYKGLLLMGVGAVIHATGQSRLSRLGGLANRMRAVFVLYMVAAVSISSFPLFSGFVSKELATEAASAAGYGVVVILLKVASVGTFLSVGLKLPYAGWFGPQGPGPRTNRGAHLAVGPVPMSMYVAMGISAVANIAIGVYPSLLYDLLPHPELYDVYTLGKVLETSQILLFTALATWLLLPRLATKEMLSLDTDVVYRRLPSTLRARWHTLRPQPTSDDAAASASSAGVRTAVLTRFTRERTRPPTLAATWMLGAVVLVTGILLFVLALGGSG